MKRYNSFKITSLALEGFRCFPIRKTFDLGDITCISGSNGKGKTSIAHAISFVFFGVSFFGEQNIDMLQNNSAKFVKAELQFQDENGMCHTLVRTREDSRTTLSLDGIQIRQSDIPAYFCDKDMFLSLFNPLYFVESIGEKGREFLQKLLPPISNEIVLNELPKCESLLLKKQFNDIDYANVNGYIKKCRDDKRLYEDNTIHFDGQLELLSQQFTELVNRRKTCEHKLNTKRERLGILTAKQFANIDIEQLKSELTDSRVISEKVLTLETKKKGLTEKEYFSKYTDLLSEINAELKSLSTTYNSLKSRLSNISPGDICPTCHVQITESNIDRIKSELATELKDTAIKGNSLVAQKKEVIEFDSKAKITFEEFKANELAVLNQEIEELTVSVNSGQTPDTEQLLAFGNLSDEEVKELESLKSEIPALDAELKVIFSTHFLCETTKIKRQKVNNDVALKETILLISALNSFAAKLAELSVAELQMPNVELKLFELVRSTGELKNVFKFTYQGRDYRSLSLSEKIRAGLEVSAMIRRVSNLDYPIFIDNTESITDIDTNMFPTQTMLSRVAKNSELKTAVSSHNNIAERQAA